MKKVLIISLCFLVAASVIFSAQFKLSVTGDMVTSSAGILLVGSNLVYEKFKPYDGSGNMTPDIDSVNLLDKQFIRSYSEKLDKASTVMAGLSLLSPAILSFSPSNQLLSLGVMYAESLLLSYGAKELLKNLVPRERPYMYTSLQSEQDLSDGDFCRSFPSGHTTLAFTSASFLSYAFCTVFPKSKWKVPVVAGSFILATGVAVARIESGSHFLSDVIAGAAIGMLSGFLVPLFHTTDDNSDASKVSLNVAILPNTLSFRISV